MNSALALGKPLNYSVSSLIKMGIIPFTTELQHDTHPPIFIVTDSTDIYCDPLVQTTLAFFCLGLHCSKHHDCTRHAKQLLHVYETNVRKWLTR